jgi:hypothetical protein
MNDGRSESCSTRRGDERWVQILIEKPDSPIILLLGGPGIGCEGVSLFHSVCMPAIVNTLINFRDS